MNKNRVLIADDHPVVRQGIGSRLEIEEDIELVGEAVDGLQAVALAEKLKPDVLVLDLLMPGLSGLDVIPRVKKHSPNTEIIVLSINDDESYVLQALISGAKGYVLKNSSLDLVVHAIREVHDGNYYLGPPLSEWAIETYIQKTLEGNSIISQPLYDQLTEREQEIFHLILEDLTNAEIAQKLSISRRTVETHRANLMSKLNVNSKFELYNFAAQHGFISDTNTKPSK